MPKNESCYSYLSAGSVFLVVPAGRRLDNRIIYCPAVKVNCAPRARSYKEGVPPQFLQGNSIFLTENINQRFWAPKARSFHLASGSGNWQTQVEGQDLD